MSNANLALGPMSSEAIEAVFRYSHENGRELMLIASKSQIDHHGGYVNGWTTTQYCEYVSSLKNLYPNSNVKICRDHCGPGFNGIYELEDTYETIKCDIENGFDFIHIDFCHFKGTKEQQLEESKKAIEYCLKLNPKISLEIGTDENVGVGSTIQNLSRIEKEVDYFKSFCNPEFYVVQTGTLVREINQVGIYNKDFVNRASQMLTSKGIKLKEHNADYLDKESLALRRNINGAVNIAPQLGVIQTVTTLNKCLIYGISIDEFMSDAYESKKWQKWLYKNDAKNRTLCSIIAGHYVFNSESYKEIIRKLSGNEDIKESIINSFIQLIKHYEQR